MPKGRREEIVYIESIVDKMDNFERYCEWIIWG